MALSFILNSEKEIPAPIVEQEQIFDFLSDSSSTALEEFFQGFGAQQDGTFGVDIGETTGDAEQTIFYDETVMNSMMQGAETWAQNNLVLEQPVFNITPHFENVQDGFSGDVGMVNGVVGSADQSPREQGSTVDDRVCYGMIHHVDALLLGKMSLIQKKLSTPGESSNKPRVFQRFTLSVKSNNIFLSFPDDSTFGQLHLKTTLIYPWCALVSSPELQFEAIGLVKSIQNKIAKVVKAHDAVVQVDINIYGPRDQSDKLGERLSNYKLWLQRPDYQWKKYPYFNPHVIRFPGLDNGTQPMIFIDETSGNLGSGERVQAMVVEIQNSTHRADALEGVSGDARLLTKLLKHQEQALAFMLQRESGNVPEEFCLWKHSTIEGQEMYIHRITKTRSAIKPHEAGGGILADDMGMGKSLSTLALVINTMTEGQKWAEEETDNTHAHSEIKDFTRSTLVVVPSALLINNWLNEVKLHLGDNVKVIRYHGQQRERDVKKLADSDIVLTTYKTLSTDFASSKSPLHELFWYRVVLDEAHEIRRPTTTFHKTCIKLNARSRWCLTGTPIQNRLEDIASLLAFLRVEPFSRIWQFRRFLSVPFDNNDAIAKERLVTLYDSLVLRRTKSILQLPGQKEINRELTLSDAERNQYKYLSGVLDRCLQQQVYMRQAKARFGLFQISLQLRIFCDLGTHQNPLSLRKRDIKNDTESLLSELALDAEKQCINCKQPRPLVSLHDPRGSFVEGCAHVLCLECEEGLAGQEATALERHCPQCWKKKKTRAVKPKATKGGKAAFQTDTVMHDAPVDDDGNSDGYFRTVGFSTKMTELVKDVKVAIRETVQGSKEGERNPSKSIIFSCWTRTLNLIQIYLKRENIKFLRIDGECPLSKRQQILDRFAKPGGCQVMLMTTGTGAFGLNLTAANRVFIVEPQWNPSVENQAVARAIRLRQQDKVVVTRYMMLETVEQEMRSQQDRKKHAAQAGFAKDDN